MSRVHIRDRVRDKYRDLSSKCTLINSLFVYLVHGEWRRSMYKMIVCRRSYLQT